MMYSCGMHDDSGVFAFEVGIPAKSGITGALIAVVPGVLGIATYSPRVNRRGASVRGWATLRDLSGTLGLGLFERLIKS
jgi:glutaminase